MPLTGEAKREANRQAYLRRKAGLTAARADAQTACEHLRPREVRVIEGVMAGKNIKTAMVEAGIGPNATSIRRRLEPGGDMAEALRKTMEAEGLTLSKLVRKTAAKLDATKPFRGGGEDGGCIEAEDNDAQLRAVEIGLKIHERAGTIPSAVSSGPAGASITVNIVRFGDHITPQDVVSGDPITLVNPQVCDSTEES